MLSPVTQAGFKSGTELLSQCKAWVDETDPKGMRCDGYVTGIIDMHQVLVDWDDLPAMFCMPHGATNDQVIRVVLKYLETHPEYLHHNPSGLAINAIIKAFPCE